MHYIPTNQPFLLCKEKFTWPGETTWNEEAYGCIYVCIFIFIFININVCVLMAISWRVHVHLYVSRRNARKGVGECKFT